MPILMRSNHFIKACGQREIHRTRRQRKKFYLFGFITQFRAHCRPLWYETTVAALSESIAAWYDDLQMVRGENSLHTLNICRYRAC